MEEARVHAALQATCASITCAMKRIRGKEDVQTRMAAGFGAGAMFRLMTRMGGPYLAADAVILGVVCALVAGTMHQLDQTHSQPAVEYTRTRCMLSNLGLQSYEKNFEKGLLTDITMPLLTESVLKDVGVPPGPRLLILDNIARDPELQKTRQGRAVKKCDNALLGLMGEVLD
ncbi:chloroplastic import inner membrane translocase subunit HP30-2-like [Papaver somniferum]|uniref:chloroplastic import inner membrane translocase subunit HP30-2-like n=1 Tax=Papaver somniferum TaxID=3469 RepID=UPI000E6FFA25|nr:chloroplastic import inner membrane translocase subunit HP30-2-like [Papaver somniferum]